MYKQWQSSFSISVSRALSFVRLGYVRITERKKKANKQKLELTNEKEERTDVKKLRNERADKLRNGWKDET